MNNKVAIVTGAGKGIGLAIAKQLMEDGFKVALADVDFPTVKKAAASISGARAYQVDVAAKEQIFKLIAQVVDDFGHLDVMVNNAGITKELGIEEMDEKSFDQMWAINVKGVLFGIQAAAAQFKKQKSKGKIISAASIGAYQVAEKHSGYSATKFAVRSLTQGAAKELGKDNITVNAYCPGYVATPMMESILQHYAEQNGTTIEEEIARGSQRIALKRPEYPEDVANLVSFLASDKADYITGQAYVTDGGVIFK